MRDLSKVIVAGVALVTAVWAGFAYYVTSEDAKSALSAELARSKIEARVAAVENKQLAFDALHRSISNIEKQLVRIESAAESQKEIKKDVKALTEQVSELKNTVDDFVHGNSPTDKS